MFTLLISASSSVLKLDVWVITADVRLFLEAKFSVKITREKIVIGKSFSFIIPWYEHDQVVKCLIQALERRYDIQSVIRLDLKVIRLSKRLPT